MTDESEPDLTPEPRSRTPPPRRRPPRPSRCPPTSPPASTASSPTWQAPLAGEASQADRRPGPGADARATASGRSPRSPPSAAGARPACVVGGSSRRRGSRSWSSRTCRLRASSSSSAVLGRRQQRRRPRRRSVEPRRARRPTRGPGRRRSASGVRDGRAGRALRTTSPRCRWRSSTAADGSPGDDAPERSRSWTGAPPAASSRAATGRLVERDRTSGRRPCWSSTGRRAAPRSSTCSCAAPDARSGRSPCRLPETRGPGQHRRSASGKFLTYDRLQRGRSLAGDPTERPTGTQE